MIVWLGTADPQFLQHKLGTSGSILATMSGVLKYLLIIFHLYSRHMFEFVTRCASVHTPSHVLSEIILAVSASHFCFIWVGPLGFIDKKTLYTFVISFLSPSPFWNWVRMFSIGVGFKTLPQSLCVVKKERNCKYLKKSLFRRWRCLYNSSNDIRLFLLISWCKNVSPCSAHFEKLLSKELGSDAW